ncbi:DUF4176 domain-containing protein [Ligilactobacillus acidipiscis]|uniref:DUF4176 domain-containing protein n=1 Tax=Ligilactobacillus acidipiscis TaxID=89059 RepID=UPI003D79266E
MSKGLLPLGSLFDLGDSTAKLMIIGRGVVLQELERAYNNYIVVAYPEKTSS